MLNSDITAALRLPLLANLNADTRDKVLVGASCILAPPNTVLFRQGEAADFIHVLISGIVELSRMEGDDECGVMMFSSGDIFMPAAAVFSEPYLVSGLVLAPSRLVLIRADILREQAEEDATLAMQLCRLVAGQWRMAVRHILDLKCRSAAQRLGAFLLRIVDEETEVNSAELPIPKRHLAIRLGMKSETLSRTLQQIADNGLYLRGKRIVVKDRQKIEAFCGPDPYPDRSETGLGVHAL